MYVVRKTEETPKSGVNYSEVAKGFTRAKAAEIKFAEQYPELYDSFEFGTAEVLGDYFQLTYNSQHSKIPESERSRERQRLLDEIAEKLHLQIKYVPADGYYYSEGTGFLKNKT